MSLGVTGQTGSAAVVIFTLHLVAANAGIGGVSSMSRWAGTKRFVRYGLARSLLGAECKFTRIFTFVSARQRIQDACQIVGTDGIGETLIG